MKWRFIMESVNITTRLRVKELLKDRRWTTKVLSEKTGMSESYLTHIKNGTRRWNEDALKKLAFAFDLQPADILEKCGGYEFPNLSSPDSGRELDRKACTDLKLRLIPVLGDIPSIPSKENNKVIQVATGHNGEFIPTFGIEDESLFAYFVKDNALVPTFLRGDYLIISPELWTRSGDVVAVECEKNGSLKKIIARIDYSEDMVVLECLNDSNNKIVFYRNKDDFKVIGKVVYRYQKIV